VQGFVPGQYQALFSLFAYLFRNANVPVPSLFQAVASLSRGRDGAANPIAFLFPACVFKLVFIDNNNRY
jgi:hypothetical protein